MLLKFYLLFGKGQNQFSHGLTGWTTNYGPVALCILRYVSIAMHNNYVYNYNIQYVIESAKTVPNGTTAPGNCIVFLDLLCIFGFNMVFL